MTKLGLLRNYLVGNSNILLYTGVGTCEEIEDKFRFYIAENNDEGCVHKSLTVFEEKSIFIENEVKEEYIFENDEEMYNFIYSNFNIF